MHVAPFGANVMDKTSRAMNIIGVTKMQFVLTEMENTDVTVTERLSVTESRVRRLLNTKTALTCYKMVLLLMGSIQFILPTGLIIHWKCIAT